VGQGLLGDEKGRLGGPAQVLLGEAHLLLAQGSAMGFGPVLLVGAAVGQVRAGHDERGAGVSLGGADGGGDALQVVSVHALHVPAVGLEAPAPVLGEGQVGAALDGDAVVVVEVDELAQAQVAGQRGGLGGDAFHQVAVADDGVDVVVNDLVAGAVEAGGQVGLGDGHAHAVGEALPQRAGGGLHAGREAVFGMAWSAAAPLPEVHELLQGEVVAGEVQQAVEQHGAVTGREDEAVPIGPVGVGRVVPQEARPQHIGHVRRPHGHPRMARFGPLYRIHGQGADGVDA